MRDSAAPAPAPGRCRAIQRCGRIWPGDLTDIGPQTGPFFGERGQPGLLLSGRGVGRLLFQFDYPGLVGELLPRGAALRLKLFGALHAFDLAIFYLANLGFGEADLMLQRRVLFIGLDAARLVAKLYDLLLLVLEVTLHATALGVFFLDGLLDLLNRQFLLYQLFFEFGEVFGQRCNFTAQTDDALIGILYEHQGFYFGIHHQN